MNNTTDTFGVAAAVAAVAKASEPLVAKATELIGQLLGEPFKLGGSLVSEQVEAFRWRMRVSILNKAEAVFAANPQIAKKALPPSFVLPFMNEAGLVDDDSLQARWANLLVNATRDTEAAERLYVETLKMMTPGDAALFDHLAHEGRIRLESRMTVNGPLRTGPQSYRYQGQARGATTNWRNIGNLIRLGLADEGDVPPAAIEKVRERLDSDYVKRVRKLYATPRPTELRVTLYGRDFFAAISSPPAHGTPAEPTTPDAT